MITLANDIKGIVEQGLVTNTRNINAQEINKKKSTNK